MFSRRDHTLFLRFARFAAIVFALLQMASPAFHVCSPFGAASTRGVLMTCHGAVSTEGASAQEVQAMRVAFRLFSIDKTPAATGDAGMMCLTQLLNTMGSVMPPLPQLRLDFASRVLGAAATPHFISLAALPQPPARGPPLFSV